MATTAWHTLSVKETLQALRTTTHGLSHATAAASLRRYGLNTIQPRVVRTPLQLFVRQFMSPLIYILLVATLISSYIGQRLDAAIILAIVILNAVIGFIQEQKAENSVASIAALLAPKARVIRDGKARDIPADQVTIGDVVELAEGTQIPADLRVIQSFSLLIDEASLTGESLPVEKSTRLLPDKTALGARQNLAFAGTNVVSGRGLGVVVAVGTRTEFGSMVEATSVLEDSTPLADELSRIGRAALWIVLAITGILGVVGLIQQRDPISLLLTAIATAVSAVPEGLPVLITVTLAMGVQRLAAQRVAVRRLASLETLGQIDTIVSDKTGTLTENELVVQRVFLPSGEPIHVSGSGYELTGRFTQQNQALSPTTHRAIHAIAVAATIANNATLESGEKHAVVHGDPTEIALLALAEKIGAPVPDIRDKFRRVAEVPFSSHIRFMAVAHTTSKPSVIALAAKGNPSVILDRCTRLQHADGSTTALTEKQRETILKTITEAGKKGYRMLAIATGRSPDRRTLEPHDITGLTYLGTVGMLDAPRPSAIHAIQGAVKDGIRVIMATGDTAPTAQAVARQLGLLHANSTAITERSIIEASTTELTDLTKRQAVFAEISPKMKLEIVRALQSGGSMVAVTGDGANDAPILKGADIGISMGHGSTDIARDVADMVLLDNNFASIPVAIQEGRRVAATLRRVVWYILATNVSELVLLGIALLIGLPLPLLPTQILWINIITDGVAVSGLLFEPLHTEHDGIGNRILTASLVKRALLIATVMGGLCAWIFFFTLQHTASLEQAQTTTFFGLAVLHLVTLLATRSLYVPIRTLSLRSNPTLISLVVLSVGLTLTTINIPVLQQAFHTVPLSLENWGTIGLAAVILLGGLEAQKEIARSLAP